MKYSRCFFVLCSLISPDLALAQECSLIGTWIIQSGKLSNDNDLPYNYASNPITFGKDSVELGSGFFYSTIAVGEDYEPGSYPFYYYAKKESYRIDRDSLYIQSSPYGNWRSFRIECSTNDIIKLNGTTGKISIRKEQTLARNIPQIEYIKAHIYGNGGITDLWKLNYKVTFLESDRLIYEVWDTVSVSFKKSSFALKKGQFREICEGFSIVDFKKIKKKYSSESSEFHSVKLTIGMKSGAIIRTELQNDDYPEALRMALTPVLYLHQRYVYRTPPTPR